MTPTSSSLTISDQSKEFAIVSATASGESSSTTIRYTNSAAKPAANVTRVLRSVEAAPVRSALRSTLRDCEEALERLLDNECDVVLRSNSFAQLQSRLATLWEMRADFQDAFAETINSLQCLLRDRNETMFSKKEIATLQSVIALMGESSEIDDEVANEVTESLLKGGFDVFRELG